MTTALAAIGDYYALSKPRIIALLLVTTAASMAMAARGVPPLRLLFWTLLGGALASASAGAFNCVWDADIDRIMRRTQSRPIPQGRISIRNATIYAGLTGAASFILLYTLVNPLAAWLSLLGLVYYVVVYTMWLKRRTPQNIVIGGAAGALPPVIGWVAVTGSVGLEPLILFLIIFLWTPPHFWALSLNLAGEYARAGVPMLPVVAGKTETKRQILLYSALLVPISLLPCALGFAGAIYGAAAAMLGAILIFLAWQVRRSHDKERRPARRLFVFSMLYLVLLFGVLLMNAAPYDQSY